MRISVVISVYNEAATIRGCLESLQRQLRPADEVIIVDNNCADATIAIANEFPVKVVKEGRQGIWAARTTGYDAAKGDILVCTDADARFPEDWLSKIEGSFDDPNVLAVSGPGKFFDGNRLSNALGYVFYMQAYFVLFGSALAAKPLFGSNFAMRRSAWQKVRQEVHNDSEAVFDDMDLSYHLLKYGRIWYRPQLYNYISIRPLRDPIGMLKRYRTGLRTVTQHAPEQSPWRLYAAKLKGN